MTLCNPEQHYRIFFATKNGDYKTLDYSLPTKVRVIYDTSEPKVIIKLYDIDLSKYLVDEIVYFTIYFTNDPYTPYDCSFQNLGYYSIRISAGLGEGVQKDKDFLYMSSDLSTVKIQPSLPLRRVTRVPSGKTDNRHFLQILTNTIQVVDFNMPENLSQDFIIEKSFFNKSLNFGNERKIKYSLRSFYELPEILESNSITSYKQFSDKYI